MRLSLTLKTGIVISVIGFVLSLIPMQANADTCPSGERILRNGSSGDDVALLQSFLSEHGVYPEGLITGYYGELTEKAVQEWQTKRGIVSEGTPDTTGYGQYGPITAASIAEICVMDSIVDDVMVGVEVQPIGGTTYNLSGSGVSSAATSITLASLTIPQTGQKLQDSDFSSTFYATLEPGNRTRQEFVSCTTVTQNANGTATLSGCSRGLAPVTPYTASTSLQFAHAGGTQVIFSDPPQLWNQFAAKANDETITGQWTFSTFPITPSNATSSETVAGVVELATQTEAANSTSVGATTARLVLPSSMSTSTYATSTAPNRVILTNTSGVIDPKFLGTTTINFYPGATSTFAGPVNASATSSVFIGAFKAWDIGKQIQAFTSTGTTTFTVPSGITKVKVWVIGGGGAGGACSAAGSASSAGGGGGGGGAAYENVNVSGTTTIQVYVGGATQWSTFGTNGFYLSATGGTNGTDEGSGGSAGTGSGGDINASGNGGGAGSQEIGSSSSAGQSGVGGMSGFGFGGGGPGTGNLGGGGVAGGTYGGGGSGGSCGSGQSAGGGAGAQGGVFVEW